MNISFRNLRKEDFGNVRKLALRGWYFSYSHLKKPDIEKLVEKHYSYESLNKALKAMHLGKQLFVLAFGKKKLIGFCNISIKKRKGELLRLYIEPKLIGKGFGKRLLKLGEDYLRKKKIKKYFAYVNKHNKIGSNFYLRNNFIRFPKKDMDDEFESKALLYMEKVL